MPRKKIADTTVITRVRCRYDGHLTHRWLVLADTFRQNESAYETRRQAHDRRSPQAARGHVVKDEYESRQTKPLQGTQRNRQRGTKKQTPDHHGEQQTVEPKNRTRGSDRDGDRKLGEIHEVDQRAGSEKHAGKGQRPDESLQQETDLNQADYADEEVQQPCVNKHGRHKPPPFTIGRAWPEIAAPGDERLRLAYGTGIKDHPHEDCHVQGDQGRCDNCPGSPRTESVAECVGPLKSSIAASLA